MDETWRRVTPFDTAGRRALWVRVTDDAVELRAGREGDDSSCRLPLDGTATLRDVRELEDVATTALFGVET